MHNTDTTAGGSQMLNVVTFVDCCFVSSFPQSEKEKSAEEVDFRFMLKQKSEREKRKN